MTQEKAWDNRTAGRIAEFDQCEFAQMLGMKIKEARPGRAKVVMEVSGTRNPRGSIHGGAIFTLADQAFAIAANLEEIPQVAVSAHITYISPGKDYLEAVAERVSEDEIHSLYRVTVSDGERLVAVFDGVGLKVRTVPEE